MTLLLPPHFGLSPAERDAVFRGDPHAFSRKSFEVINNGKPIQTIGILRRSPSGSTMF